jgi:hypothetical protein
VRSPGMLKIVLRDLDAPPGRGFGVLSFYSNCHKNAVLGAQFVHALW